MIACILLLHTYLGQLEQDERYPLFNFSLVIVDGRCFDFVLMLLYPGQGSGELFFQYISASKLLLALAWLVHLKANI